MIEELSLPWSVWRWKIEIVVVSSRIRCSIIIFVFKRVDLGMPKDTKVLSHVKRRMHQSLVCPRHIQSPVSIHSGKVAYLTYISLLQFCFIFPFYFWFFHYLQGGLQFWVYDHSFLNNNIKQSNMSWRSSSKPPPPPTSTLSKVFPLLLVFVILAVLAFVGFQVYSTANSITGTTRKRLEKKNVTFTRDGMQVGVKEVNNEKEVDRTQGWVG